MPKMVLVTGASGYIGGETMLRLKDQGYTVVGVDTRRPPAHLIGVPDRFYQEDFASAAGIELLDKFAPDAIIHCAGTSLVGPSINNPNKYYDNNFVKTKRFLDAMIEKGVRSRFIFSSSAAAYGEPVMVPCREEDPPMPISPYGESKVMVEMMLNAYATAYNLDSVAFRYFNACGADHQCRHGQEPGATHIIARVLESLRDGKDFVLFGSSYPTQDGSCVRDYVHVEDIADAHIRAIDVDVPAGVYNLGTSAGISNLEIIAQAEKVTGRKVSIVQGPNRAGDPAVLTASAEKFTRVSGWSPAFKLDDMIRHAWRWYTQ